MVEVVECKYHEYGSFYALAQDGRLLEAVNRFLLWKKDTGGRRGRKLSTGSQRQYAYHMKYLLDVILNNEKEWNTISSHDIKTIRDQMDRGEDGLSRVIINIRTHLWSEFYLWCRDHGYDHNVHIKFIEMQDYINNDDDMLSYTRRDRRIKRTEFWLPALDKSRVFPIVSHTTWQKLRQALREIDPMYEAIAIVMITTGLRINGALQLKKTSFLPYPELDPYFDLDFRYIPKGEKDTKKKKTCIFPIDTWAYLHENIAHLRQQRAELFQKKHGKRPDEMFLKYTGSPVRDFDVWNAFKQVSNEIGVDVVPHMLRHTFATWTVLIWAEKEGIRPTTESFYKDIHDMLRDQLGHSQISTTKKYCKTASMYRFKKILPRVSAKAMEKTHIKQAYDKLFDLQFFEKGLLEQKNHSTEFLLK